MTTRSNTFFRSPGIEEFTVANLIGGLNNTDSDFDILNNELSDGQNMIKIPHAAIGKRDGISLYGNFIGTTTGILGGFNFVNQAGTQDQLIVYDTVLKRYNAGNWDDVSGVTFTTGKQADGAYFPFNDKFYIVNNQDNVVKYTSSASVDQSDSSFKKGKYIEHFQNRLLVANVSGQENRVWYTDNQVDTFGANNWFQVDGNIIGLRTYFDKILTFTKRKIYRLANFSFDGTSSWASQLYDLPIVFGTIADRSIQIVNGYIYFLGQDTDGKCSIYKCDGMSAEPISDDKIQNTMNSLSTSQLENACAIADGNNYLLYVAESGQTTNNIGIVYDTTTGLFQPIERRLIAGRVDFSCLFASETSGQWEIYAGTQGSGQVYKLHANEGLYDELPEERYLTQGSVNMAIDVNPAKRGAQSFKLSQYNASQSIYITKLALFLKKVSGTTTELTVRIETDDSGKPSGTLVHASATATISAFTDTSYLWKIISFTPFTVAGNTTYWLVLQHTTEGSGDSKYSWLADSCTSTYANGNVATYASSAWTGDTTTDACFVIYVESAIDAYADSKAFLINNGKEFQLRRFQSIFSTVGSYSMEVGFATGGFSTFENYLIDLTGNTGAVYDSTNKYDDGSKYDSATENRKYNWKEVSSFIGRVVKVRIRNRNANQQFEFNRLTLIISKHLRQV